MVHGPYGHPNCLSLCMKDGKHTKQYQQELIRDTVTADNGYSQYRRPIPGIGRRFARIQHCGPKIKIDNKWIAL